MSPLRQAPVAVVAVLIAGLAAPPPALGQHGPIERTVAAAGLRIDGFDVEQVQRLEPGTPLQFSLYGSPGARVTLRIDGAAASLALAETGAGVYEGTYVVAAADAITPGSRVVARLERAGESTRIVLDEPLVLGAALPAGCPDCAVVETIHAVQEPGRPGVVGALTGSVVGAILGSRFGRGDGRAAGGIVGAVGGAMVGREIERRYSVRTRYEVAVRGPDGSVLTQRYDAPPPLRVGDRVRWVGGAWLAEPAP